MSSNDRIQPSKVYDTPVNVLPIDDPSTVIVFNQGPGTVYLSYENQNNPDAGMPVAAGEKMTIRTDRSLYYYGSSSDPDVTLPGGAGKAWVIFMVTVA